MTLIIIILLVLFIGGGGGYYGYNRWAGQDANGFHGFGSGLVTVLVILLVLYLLHII